MNSQIAECNLKQIEDYLSDQLAEDQVDALVQHLDECATCRRQLEYRAAQPENWQEAQDFLQDPDFRRDLESACPSEHHGDDSYQLGSEQGLPHQVEQVLATLVPSEDPSMLGRLGSYEVSGVIGVGGMGVVLKATDRALERTVAIKVLSPHLATSGAARFRFAREARAAAAIVHPHVIAIHGVAKDGPLPWFVMPYVKGMSLQARIDQEGPLTVEEILRIGSQIAKGLAAAHAQGLVHRDIKPANILLEDGIERVTITDFGLARTVDDAAMTRSGMIAGTPQYMSPEQALGEPVDNRSDLFSLGSLLYAMCAGHSPFRAESVVGILRRIADDAPRPVEEINRTIPQWLSRLVNQLMEKDPALRPKTADDVAGLLDECLAHVQQPTKNELPQEVLAAGQPQAGLRKFISLWCWTGAITALLGLVAWSAAPWFAAPAPPDIAGTWISDSWGEVELEKISRGEYRGEFNEDSGLLLVQWSAAEQRYNGTWRNTVLLHGKISLRKQDGKILGARTLHRKIESDETNPRLAEFVWRSTSHDSADRARDLELDDLKIKISRARLAVTRAENNLAVAETSLTQYEQGTFLTQKNEKEIAILEAQSDIESKKIDLANSEETLAHTQKLLEKSLVSENQLKKDASRLQQAKLQLVRAENNLKLAETQFEVLTKITYPKQQLELNAKIESAKAELRICQDELSIYELQLQKKYWPNNVDDSPEAEEKSSGNGRIQ